jgi:hypothetical protein
MKDAIMVIAGNSFIPYIFQSAEAEQNVEATVTGGVRTATLLKNNGPESTPQNKPRQLVKAA